MTDCQVCCSARINHSKSHFPSKKERVGFALSGLECLCIFKPTDIILTILNISTVDSLL